ncbi:MAG: TetR/AcrR family transcriptional regulator [Campylobacteraceae bacterium]|nr:TetR/AcrR family transcriptional regulator [Campylobacteraceae bacterium]
MEKCVILEFIKNKCQKKKSNYHHGNLKEELLQQAVQLIHEKGVDALTLQVLASKLGTSRSAIYRHFSSKNELMHNVMLYGFEMFNEKVSPIFMKEEESAEKRLYLMGKEYINFALEHPNLYRMLFGEKFQDIRTEGCDIEDEDQARGFHAVIALLAEGQEKKEFKVGDPMLQAQIIHAMIHGLASLCIDGHIHFSDKIDDLYEVCMNTITEGLLLKK